MQRLIKIPGEAAIKGGGGYTQPLPSTGKQKRLQGGRLHTSSLSYRIITEVAGEKATHSHYLLLGYNRGCRGAGATQPLPATG